MFHARGYTDAPLTRPMRSRFWSTAATTSRSTETTSTTGAWLNEAMKMSGGSVLSMVSGATLVGCTGFQGFSPAISWAMYRRGPGGPGSRGGGGGVGVPDTGGVGGL